MKKQSISILGSTGSIGRQAIEVILAHSDVYEVDLLTANQNADLLIEQAVITQPNAVIIYDEDKYEYIKSKLAHLPIKIFAGESSVIDYIDASECNTVIAAIMGFAGLLPVIKAIEKKKRIALANKETLVVAGEIIQRLVEKHNVPFIPIDSEHSALFQCLVGEPSDSVEKLILTASGGPFRNLTLEELEKVTAQQALQHPTWNMGKKITIDSATLMNKGLEVIEAYWLFGIPTERIQVLVHPQSIIHSMVQFQDGSIKAQLGLPDMRVPIQYALTYPTRRSNPFPKIDFTQLNNLQFFEPDTHLFPCLQLAYQAIDKGGNMPCVLNAANEIAVEAFLMGKINFYDIPKMIEAAISKISLIQHPSLQQLIETDKETRIFANSLI
ncbi:MAG TPA: 1-deoxy-D-xylulose-5-phosphate reductoisomerase [Bacteroidales bacterium]|nr:1-deoxy-D-xylulose-5-phosphate reductoisomerase [Bacteroidales bacterium]